MVLVIVVPLVGSGVKGIGVKQPNSSHGSKVMHRLNMTNYH